LGYAEGRNLATTARFAEGYEERLPDLASELVGLKPAILVGNAIDAAVQRRKVTATIPIVCPLLANAIQLKLIASMARPGGNVTGITPYVDGFPAKQMELARELVPGATKVGLLVNLNDPKALPARQEMVDAGPKV